jgi:cytochrome c-type biogenesis protein
MMATIDRTRNAVRVGLVAAAIAALGVLGFVVFGNISDSQAGGAGLLVLAAGAGVASFFSPCSFPLLTTMLARPVAAAAEASGGRPYRKALTFASAMSVGAAVFLLAFGAIIALGGDALFGGLSFTGASGRILRGVLGALLITLGLIQLKRLPISLRRFEPATRGFLGRQAKLRRRHPFRGFTLFGFGYLAAGFGCTGPILIGLTGQALLAGGFGAALLAYVVAAAALTTLMFTLALTLASAQERVVQGMVAGAPTVKRWGGRILLIVGGWFIVVAIFASTFSPLFDV